MEKLPPVPTMAATLAVETAKHVAGGCKHRLPEEVARITKICELCDHPTRTTQFAKQFNLPGRKWFRVSRRPSYRTFIRLVIGQQKMSKNSVLAFNTPLRSKLKAYWY